MFFHFITFSFTQVASEPQTDSLMHGYKRLSTNADEQARFAGQGLRPLDTGPLAVPLSKSLLIRYTLGVFHLMALFYSQ